MRSRPERIRRYRILAGHTQTELAARAGISATTLYRIESGRSNGGLKALHAIATALGVDFESIVDIEAA